MLDETRHQTPSIDTHCVCYRDDKILQANQVSRNYQIFRDPTHFETTQIIQSIQENLR